MVFRQLFDPQSSTYTYLLGDPASGAAVLIDPVFEQARRDAALVEELGLKLAWTVETHVHADHVTAAALLRSRTGSRVAAPRAAGVEGADLLVDEAQPLEAGGIRLEALATPGHTAGCTSYVLADRSMVFTGDALLVRGCGRTDFQGGDARALFRSVRDKLFSLPDDCAVYPGHDYRGIGVTTIGEEKRHNPRLALGVGEEDFVGYMENLGLPHPKKMADAVPANLQCGSPAGGFGADADPDWAPLTFTFAGVWEVEPGWLEEHAREVQVVDVREPAEYAGPLGHIPGAVLLPLGNLQRDFNALDKGKPVVTVCRSGARSAQAAVVLGREGFTRVANLPGGMLRWRAEGHPVEGGRE